MPFWPLFAKYLCKPLDQTLTLAAASRFTTKVFGEHLPGGLGRGQQRGAGTAHDDRAAHPQQFAAALFHSRSERKKVAVSKESGSKHQSSN